MKTCDNRDFSSREIREFLDSIYMHYRENPPMADENEAQKWLAEEIRARGRGTKRALASVLGVSPDAITRMLNTDPTKETRMIKSDELRRMAVFFGSNPPGFINPERAPLPSREGLRWIQVTEQLANALLLVQEFSPEDESQLVGFAKGLVSSRLRRAKVPPKDPDQET